jgi:hypothetical protein
VNFTWTTVPEADTYWLDVGNSVLQGDISAGPTPGNSRTVLGLPCDGRTIYVQLWTRINGAWQAPQQYTYNAASVCTEALMVSPVPGSTLSDTGVTFTWTAIAGADSYWLDVGNSVAVGDIFAGPTAALSATVVGLPCDGRTLHVQLWTHLNGIWRVPQQYTYTATSNCGANVAQIISPPPASTLSGTAVTFTWIGVAGADNYWLDIGNSVGQGDLSAGATSITSRPVAGLPCDGRTLYVQVWTHVNGTWRTPQQYTYRATSNCTGNVAQMTSPLPGAALSNTTAVFTWTSVVGADNYWLDVGNYVAVGDIFAGSTVATAQTVNNLPCDGRPLYVQLWTHLNGTWQPPQRYTYVATTNCGGIVAQMINPVPGSTLLASALTFTWTPIGDADNYRLDIGNALGLTDLFTGQTTGTSRIVTGLPCDGRNLFVQLTTRRNGVWQTPQRYTYRAGSNCEVL